MELPLDPRPPEPRSADLHALLRRQLKRIGLDAAAAGPWAELLLRVSRAYVEHDQERYLLERSQDLASKEMASLYAIVSADRDLLESRVQERTEALRVSEARLSSLLSLSADWIWEQDAELRFTYVSDGITEAAGIDPASLIGHKRDFCSVLGPDAELIAAHQAAVDARRAFREFTHVTLSQGGERRYVRISGEPVFGDDGNFSGYRGVGRDITQITLAEQKVQELVHDNLTGLPNRSLFLVELDRALARTQRQQQEFALCFIDLDRFKTVNDTLGHDGGDELLRVMAQRLRGAVRASDLVARLGGDEFVVLLEVGNDAAVVTRVANVLLGAISAPLALDGLTFQITGSIGISMYPADGQDAATLLKHSDQAMYLAKARGKNNIQFYTAELADQAACEFALESELRLALLRNELVLHYQPKVEIDGVRMCGVEALVRWAHPTRGLVMPGEFIALAEDRGLIVPIGRWVMQAACRQIQAWRNAGLQPTPVALNLSAQQFSSVSLVDDLVEAMARHGVAATELEVELTESVLMSEPELANTALQRLHALGVKIAIDDFGTGYSSLSYLKRVPAQTVKIDRSFISGLPNDQDDSVITQAVIAMAHSLGLTVVAEGVETADQLALLRQLGCDQAQGYLLGRPMPADQLARRLEPIVRSVALSA